MLLPNKAAKMMNLAKELFPNKSRKYRLLEVCTLFRSLPVIVGDYTRFLSRMALLNTLVDGKSMRL